MIPFYKGINFLTFCLLSPSPSPFQVRDQFERRICVLGREYFPFRMYSNQQEGQKHLTDLVSLVVYSFSFKLYLIYKYLPAFQDPLHKAIFESFMKEETAHHPSKLISFVFIYIFLLTYNFRASWSLYVSFGDCLPSNV